MSEFVLGGLFDESMIATTSVPGAACSTDVTAEVLLALTGKLRAVPRPEYDALVVLPRALAGLRSQVPAVVPFVSGLWFDRLCGVPIYEASDADHAALLAAELKGEGKRPAVVCAPGDPQEIANLPPLPRMPAPLTQALPDLLTAW